MRGFFNESLTPQLRAVRGMQPALYVDLDADLFSSTQQNLDWLFASRLIKEPSRGAAGTVLGYDDWVWGGIGGQMRAHEEATRRHNVTFRNLNCCCTGWKCCKGACFEVLSMGSNAPPPGS